MYFQLPKLDYFGAKYVHEKGKDEGLILRNSRRVFGASLVILAILKVIQKLYMEKTNC